MGLSESRKKCCGPCTSPLYHYQSNFVLFSCHLVVRALSLIDFVRRDLGDLNWDSNVSLDVVRPKADPRLGALQERKHLLRPALV